MFWDTEIYLLPFYTAVWPEAARALLMYRYHTLPGARAKADAMGYKGALYAWESADTGEETTPERVVGPGGELIDILTGRMEHHISADIAYAVWQYWRATGDDGFFLDAGAEILLETARFWASRAVPEADGKRHIRHVIGPDEYHEDVDDNAFTNVMARWNIARGLEAIELLRARWPDRAAALREKLALGEAELADWRDAVGRIVTGLDPATGLYEQFAGYHAAGAARSVAVRRPHGADRRGDRPRANAAVAGGQAGRCGGAARPAAGRVPGRGGESEFPPLRAALCPWQFAERGHPRAGRGTARRNRNRPSFSAPGRGRGP